AADQQQFQHASQQHAPGRSVARRGKQTRQQQRRHHRQVEQNGCRRRSGKARERVEDAAVERDERNQEEVREGNARELDGEHKAAGVVAKSGCQQLDQVRRERKREQKEDNLTGKEEGEDAITKQLSLG